MSENNLRYCLILEYIGTEFAGSQRQPDVNTVQSEIEKAIKQILQKDIKVIFSGRTDKGVHARGQVLHFDVNQELDTKKFAYALNSVLPEQISVRNIQQVDKRFHSQKSAEYRWYQYTINNRLQRSVWLDQTSMHIKDELNIEAMQKTLSYLVGERDFTSFKASNSANPAKICNMIYASCEENSGIIKINLIANRFLYNMVRIIIGTLLQIGKGAYTPEHVLKVLEAKDRKCAGPTAEAKGLTLMKVGYSEKYNIKMTMEKRNNENILSKAS